MEERNKVRPSAQRSHARTATLAALTVMAALLNVFCCHAIDTKAAREAGGIAAPPLPDVGFRALPDLRSRQYAVLNSALAALALGALATGAIGVPGVPEALIASFLLRPLFFCCTTLPATCIRHSCYGDMSFSVRLADFGGCHDNVFSGHVAIALVLLYGMVRSRALGPAAAVAIGALFSTLVVATRAHYTVDVLVSWAVVGLLLSHADALGRLTR